METYSGFTLEALGGFYEGGCVLEEKSYLYCIESASSGDRCGLEIPARDFNVLMLREKVFGDVVDLYAIDSDKCASGSLSKGADEVNNIFDCRRSGIYVTSG